MIVLTKFNKIKGSTKVNRFADLPGDSSLSNNLEAPEVAPSDEGQNLPQKKARRKTGRTIQFATKVTKEFDEEFHRLAFENGRKKKTEFLEICLEAYKTLYKKG